MVVYEMLIQRPQVTDRVLLAQTNPTPPAIFTVARTEVEFLTPALLADRQAADFAAYQGDCVVEEPATGLTA